MADTHIRVCTRASFIIYSNFQTHDLLQCTVSRARDRLVRIRNEKRGERAYSHRQGAPLPQGQQTAVRPGPRSLRPRVGTSRGRKTDMLCALLHAVVPVEILRTCLDAFAVRAK